SREPLRWSNAHRHFLSHLVVMPRWHKGVILIAGTIAALGTVGQIATRFAQPAPVVQPNAPQPPRSAPAGGSSSFVGESADRSPAPNQAPAPSAQPANHGPLGRISPHATKVGLSIVLGFIIGWLCRAFLKTMALVAIVVIGGLWLLSH